MGLVPVVAGLGMDVQLAALADSSAAIGICRRTGIGKVCHLAVGQLWVQERARQGDFGLQKHPGSENPAGMLTQAVNQELTLRHTGAAGLSFESGRPQTAPLLDGFCWDSAPAPAAGG